MSAPKCPYCTIALQKTPARKTKCKACGQFMYLKSTPDNREKRLMTEAQAEAAERLWTAHYERRQAAQLAAVTGIRPNASVAASKPALMTLAFNPKAGRQQRKLAALSLVRLAETHEERESWNVLAYAMELDQLAAGGAVQQVMIRAEVSRCAVCVRLDQRQMSVAQAKSEMPLPPRDCPKIVEGYPCLCRYSSVPNWGGP